MTPQIPLGSGFGPRTTARDVLGDRRLDGLHVVITGGSAGVRVETTRACAGARAHVPVGARPLAKAQAGGPRGAHPGSGFLRPPPPPPRPTVPGRPPPPAPT